MIPRLLRFLVLFDLSICSTWAAASQFESFEPLTDSVAIVQDGDQAFTLDLDTGQMKPFAKVHTFAADRLGQRVLIEQREDGHTRFTLLHWNGKAMIPEASGTTPLVGPIVPTYQKDRPFCLLLVSYDPDRKKNKSIPFQVSFLVRPLDDDLMFEPVPGMTGVASFVFGLPEFSANGNLAFGCWVDQPETILRQTKMTNAKPPRETPFQKKFDQMAMGEERYLIVTRAGQPDWAWQTLPMGGISYPDCFSVNGRYLMASLPAPNNITHSTKVIIDCQNGHLTPSDFIPDSAEVLAANEDLSAVLAFDYKFPPSSTDPAMPTTKEIEALVESAPALEGQPPAYEDKGPDIGSQIEKQYTGKPGDHVELFRKGQKPKRISDLDSCLAIYCRGRFYMLDRNSKRMWIIDMDGTTAELKLTQ